MPLIAYACAGKHSVKRFFRRAKDAPASFLCTECKQEMKKLLSTPSTSSKITVDNGVQARAVEISPDIIEVNEQRSKINLRGD